VATAESFRRDTAVSGLAGGRLAPELQKLMKKVPLTPEMQAEIEERMARTIAHIEAEKKKSGK
jgi:hypothetical protein